MSFKGRRKSSFSGSRSVPLREDEIHYTNIKGLSTCLTESSRIMPSRITGQSTKLQRKLTQEVKIARYLALLPFSYVHKD